MKSSCIHILLVLIFCSSLSLPAQTYRNKEFNNLAGIKASNISGYGLYYSRELPDDFRIQLMGLIYYYQYSKEDRKKEIFNYDIGFEIQRNIYSSENSRTYILFGGYYYFDDDTDIKTDEINKVNNSYNIGTGIGFEFEYKRVVYNIDVGYKFFEDNIDTFKNGDLSYYELKRVTKAGAGIGIGFMF